HAPDPNCSCLDCRKLKAEHLNSAQGVHREPSEVTANSSGIMDSKEGLQDDRQILNCQTCRQSIRLPGGRTGTVRCPKCGAVFTADTRYSADTAVVDAPTKERTSALNAAPKQHRLTWLAIIATIVLTVPG